MTRQPPEHYLPEMQDFLDTLADILVPVCIVLAFLFLCLLFCPYSPF